MSMAIPFAPLLFLILLPIHTLFCLHCLIDVISNAALHGISSSNTKEKRKTTPKITPRFPNSNSNPYIYSLPYIVPSMGASVNAIKHIDSRILVDVVPSGR